MGITKRFLDMISSPPDEDDLRNAVSNRLEDEYSNNPSIFEKEINLSEDSVTHDLYVEDAEINIYGENKSIQDYEGDDIAHFRAKVFLSAFSLDDAKPYDEVFYIIVSGEIYFSGTSFKLRDLSIQQDSLVNDDIKETLYEDADYLLSTLSKAPKTFWFRGHGDENWMLKPSVFRLKDYSIELENMLKKDFVKKSQFLNPMMQEMEPKDTLFTMQHHGVPTRLLDWSTSVLVALYFVVCDEKQDDKDGCIWALAPQRLDMKLGGLSEDIDNLIENNSEDIVKPINAPYSNNRMVAQHSEFTLHTLDKDLRGQYFSGVFLRKITIAKDIKAELRKRLPVMGISRGTIFPDYDNIAKDIMDKYNKQEQK